MSDSPDSIEASPSPLENNLKRSEIPPVASSDVPIRTDLIGEPYPVSDSNHIAVSDQMSVPGAAMQSENKNLHRWWTTLAVIAVALGTGLLFTSFILGALAIVLLGPESLVSPQALQTLVKTKTGFVAGIVTPQLMMFVIPMVAAVLSPVDTRKRLGMVRGHWPLWAWFAAAAAAPIVAIFSSILVSQFVEPSEHLEAISEMFAEFGKGWFGLVLPFIIAGTPTLCEETLFRGYVQTRLVKSFPPWFGVLVASGLFALVHFDPVHVISVFPLGLYLGLIAYQSGSIFPAMLAHFANNFYAASMMTAGVAKYAESGSLPLALVMAVLFTLCMGVFGWFGTAFALLRYPPDNPIIPGWLNPNALARTP